MTKPVMYGGKRHEEMSEGHWGSMKDAHELSAGIILGGLKVGKERGLTDVSEPDLGGVGEDGDADGMKDVVPGDEL